MLCIQKCIATYQNNLKIQQTCFQFVLIKSFFFFCPVKVCIWEFVTLNRIMSIILTEYINFTAPVYFNHRI